MKTLFLISILFAASTLAYESPITVEGDGLELVREYRIEGDTYEMVYEDEGLAGEVKGKVSDDIIPLVLMDWGWFDGKYGSDKMAFLNSKLELDKLFTGDLEKNERDAKYGEVCRFYPIGQTGYYIKNAGFGISFQGGHYDLKSVYYFDGRFIKFIDSSYEIYTNLNSNKFLLFDEDIGRVEHIELYDTECNKLYGKQVNLGSNIRIFDKDNDRVFVRGSLSDCSAYIYSEAGEMIQELDENIDYNIYSSYASGSYICRFGEILDPDTNERTERSVLNVLDGSGDLLWEHNTEGRASGRVLVSDNERYLCLGFSKLESITKDPHEAHRLNWGPHTAIVFDLASGEELYKLPDVKTGVFSVGAISNDSSIIVWPYYKDKGEFGAGVDVFIDGYTEASIKVDKEHGRINYYMTPDGQYLIAGVPSCVKVFRITK